MNSNNHHDPLDLLSIKQYTELVQRSRRAVYYDIKAGRIHIVKLGRLTRIPRAEAERYVYEDQHPDDPPDES